MEKHDIRSIGFLNKRLAFPKQLAVGASVIALHLLLLLMVLTQHLAPYQAEESNSPGIGPISLTELSLFPQKMQHPSKNVTNKVSRSPELEKTKTAIPDAKLPLMEPPVEFPALSLTAEPISIPEAFPPAPALPMAGLVLPAGDKCDLIPALKVVLDGDGRVAAALHLIPRGSRSVANAIMLWDGEWISPNQAGSESAISPIRAALGDALQQVPQNCLQEDLVGPRLIPLTDGDGVVVLVIGSGNWRWMNLLY